MLVKRRKEVKITKAPNDPFHGTAAVNGEVVIEVEGELMYH